MLEGVKLIYVPEGLSVSWNVDTGAISVRCQPDTPISRIMEAVKSAPRPPKKQGAMSRDSFLVGKHNVPEGDVLARIMRVLEDETAPITPVWCYMQGYLLGQMDGKRAERARRHKHE